MVTSTTSPVLGFDERIFPSLPAVEVGWHFELLARRHLSQPVSLMEIVPVLGTLPLFLQI
jgi:hypothetical protein